MRYTKQISTNAKSIEAGLYRQTRGTCFVAGPFKVVAVAGLLWISWCVLDGADFFVFFFCLAFFFERPHGVLQV